MVTLARVRLLLARHPVAHWCVVAGLATGAAWLTFDTSSPSACPLPATAGSARRPSALRADEVAVPLRAIPGAVAGAEVRLFALAEPLADGRIVAVVGVDMLVAVPAGRAGGVSLAAAEGTVTIGLVGDGEFDPQP